LNNIFLSEGLVKNRRI